MQGAIEGAIIRHESGTELVQLFILVPAFLTIVVALVLFACPAVWDWTVRKTDSARNSTMDGARGLLSLWVLAYHLNVGPSMAMSAAWKPQDSLITAVMASGFPLAPFFALSAMLLGGGLLVSKGKLDTWRFLKRRFFRIVPAYAASLLLILLAVAYMSSFQLNVSVWKLAKQIIRWCLFDFVPRYEINGIDASRAHGMLWTLRYEMMFYASLPILAWLQRRFNSAAVLIIGLAAIGLFVSTFIYFAAGVVAAAFVGWKHPRAALIWQVASVVGLAVVVLTIRTSSPWLQGLLLVPILVALVHQVPLFRPIGLKPIRFIGEISYSLYILHYPILWIIFTLVIDAAWADALPFGSRIVLLAGCGCIVLALATLCYIFVERPALDFSKQGRTKPTAPQQAVLAPLPSGPSEEIARS